MLMTNLRVTQVYPVETGQNGPSSNEYDKQPHNNGLLIFLVAIDTWHLTFLVKKCTANVKFS